MCSLDPSTKPQPGCHQVTDQPTSKTYSNLARLCLLWESQQSNTSDLPEISGISTISPKRNMCLSLKLLKQIESSCGVSHSHMQPDIAIAMFSKETQKEPYLLVHHVSLSCQNFRVRKMVKEGCWDRVSVPVYYVCILCMFICYDLILGTWCSTFCQVWGLGWDTNMMSVTG